MSSSRSRLMPAGILAGIVFLVGFFSVGSMPGGGDVTDQQFLDFYGSSSKRLTSLLFYLVLVVGSWLMAWFYSELRARVGGGRLAEYAERIAWIAAVAVIVGGGVALGPVGVQVNSNRPFVGIPVAHALDQAGLMIMIAGGIYAFAVATFLMSLRIRRTAALPRWIGTSGLVVAVLLVGAYIALPAILLPLWVVAVGIVARGARAPLPEREVVDALR